MARAKFYKSENGPGNGKKLKLCCSISVSEDIDYLIGIAIALNIAAASPAFLVIEVRPGKGDSREVLPPSTEPASTCRVGSLSTPGATHVVDDSVHIDVDLWVNTVL